jgi:hypothetical protein
MAGFALVSPGTVVKPDRIIGNHIVKDGEIINSGDPVGIDSSGYVVCASKTQGAIVKCIGFAVIIDDLSGGTQTYVTGNVTSQPTSPVMVGIARHIIIENVNSTLVPSLAKGLPVYLAAVGATAGTVSALTCVLSSTSGDSIEEVGFVLPSGTALYLEAPLFNGLKLQNAGTTTYTFA